MEKTYPYMILFSSRREYSDEDVKEYNALNEINLSYNDAVAEMQRIDYEDFMGNLEYSSKNHSECVILGTLGLWNGNKTIHPMKCYFISYAIKKCLGDAESFEIRLKHGVIEVDVYHHDGTNQFQIKLLNDKGIKTENGDLRKPYYHKRLKGYLF